MAARVLALALAAALGFAHAAVGREAQSTIAGSVRPSPTCAGPQRPGQQCASPMAGAAVRLADRQGKTVRQVVTADDGSFVLHAAPGRYTLGVVTEGAYPRCPSRSLNLAPAQHLSLTIECDSGMR